MPWPPPNALSVYRSKREEGSFDTAVAGLAAVVAMSGGRVGAASVVLEGAAPIPWRAEAAEAALLGFPLTSDRFRTAIKFELARATSLPDNHHKLATFERLAIDGGMLLAVGSSLLRANPKVSQKG